MDETSLSILIVLHIKHPDYYQFQPGQQEMVTETEYRRKLRVPLILKGMMLKESRRIFEGFSHNDCQW
jgi:hypothetical protein